MNGMTLEELAVWLRDKTKRIVVLYAFNATGKTRLSKTILSNGLQTIVYSISNEPIISVDKITLLTLPTPGHISKWEETIWGKKWRCKTSYDYFCNSKYQEISII